MSFSAAIEKLGVSGATNRLSQRFMYDSSKESPALNLIKKKYLHVKYWGIYADTQADAKALATVFCCNSLPEVHIPGYGHYHAPKHQFHIWFGNKITK